MNDKELMKLCIKYLRKGKIDKLSEIVEKNDMLDNLLVNLEYFRKSYEETYTEKDYENLSNFAIKMSYNTIKEKFGESLTDKIMKNIAKEKNMCSKAGYLRNFSLYKNELSERGKENLSDILDLATENFEQGNVMGIHAIGTTIGDTLAKTGIRLTGHKFSSAFDKNENLKSKLEKNIVFATSPIDLIQSLIQQRSYNARNYANFDQNDLMMVSIPEEELKKNVNTSDIIISKGDSTESLDPKYIIGYTTMNIKTADFEGLQKNPQFYKTSRKNQEISNDDWKLKFQNWYEETNKTPAMIKIKNKVMEFIKARVQNKNRENNLQTMNENQSSLESDIQER